MAQDSPGRDNGQKQQKLSHKQRKALWRKEKRRKKRQEEARAREEELQEQGTSEAPEKAEESEEEKKRQEEAAERERQHQLWLEREDRAQQEFRLRREREETRRREQEEQERLIREEWEEQQRKEKEAKERKEREKKEQEDKLNRMLASTGTSGNKKKEEWHNPIAPADYSAGGEVPAPTGRAAEDCPFFKKTGACRFGDRCSRKHTRPDTSTTLLIPGMFGTFALDQTQRDDFDETMYLEYGEDELYKDFIEFYNDALPEFRTLGRVIQFKVCCNHEPHLRGNVYVQYEREEDCLEAIKKFHGRFYAGRQLTCEMTPVTSWKSAICGLFSRKKCPKGKNCNFLHVFPNPGREFRDADEDLHLEGLRRGQHDSRRSWREFSERRGSVSSRSWRHSSERLRSRSPPSYRSRRRRESRSRSRERSQRRSRVRSRSRSRSRRRKKSRSRSRERSRRREHDRTAKNDRDSSIGQEKGVNRNEKAEKSDGKNEDSDSGQESSNSDDQTLPEKPSDQEGLTGSHLNSVDGKETETVPQEEEASPTSARKSASPSVKLSRSRSRSRSKSRSPHKSSHHKHKRSHSHKRHRKKRKKRKSSEEEEGSKDVSSSSSDSEKEELDLREAALRTLSTQKQQNSCV